MDRLGVWLLRGLWVLLPVALGPGAAEALDPRSSAVQQLCSVGLWAAWAAILVATLVPRSLSLTAVRVAAPAAPVVGFWAAAAGDTTAVDVVGVTVGAAVAAVALLPEVGQSFVDGESYGTERRFPLRVPAPLVLGPIPLAWGITIVGPTAGVLLLAARRWLPGAVVLVAGTAAALVALRALHVLSRRWLVFVPGGVLMHDPLTLAEPVLLEGSALVELAAAEVGTSALDLTQYTVGMALEARLTDPVTFTVLRRRQPAEMIETDAVMFAPTRPGAVLAEASQRRLGGGRRPG